MRAPAKRVRTPHVRLPIEIPVPVLARASGLSPRRMLRRLKECLVPLRQRGTGTKRKHLFVTRADLKASPYGSWIIEAIEDWSVLFERLDAPEEDDDG